MSSLKPDHLHPHWGVTVRNQAHSPLLRLPGEIRNKIYSYAQGGGYILEIRDSFTPLFNQGRKEFSCNLRRVPDGPNLSEMVGKISLLFSLHLGARQVTAEIGKQAGYRNNVFDFSDLSNLAEATAFSFRYLTARQKSEILEISVSSLNHVRRNQWRGIACRRRFHREPREPIHSKFPALQRIYLRGYKEMDDEDGTDIWGTDMNVRSSRFVKGVNNSLYPVSEVDAGLEFVNMDVFEDAGEHYAMAEKICLGKDL